MAQLSQYDPGRIALVFNGVPITGFHDGTFITFARSVETWSHHVGADGTVTRVRSRDKSGTCTVVLSPGSPANDALSALALADERAGTSYGDLTCADLGGTSICSGGAAWIQKWPDLMYGDEVNPREWVFAISDLEILVGSNVILP